MSEAGGKPHKKGEGNHDGCTDCIRQKKENEAFIKIYERLQEVEKRTSQVRQAVTHHRNSSDTNRSFYRSYEQKLINLPKVKDKTLSSETMQAAGYEIAASLLEKEAKSKLIAENKKLKDILLKMQQEKYGALGQTQSCPQSKHLQNESYYTKRDYLNQSCSSQLPSCESIYLHRQDRYRPQLHREELDKLASSQETSESCNSSTQSSSFTGSKLRNSMDLSKYNDLNLWLYQNEKNAKLEEELYIVKELKPRSFVSKRNGSVLPTLKK